MGAKILFGIPSIEEHQSFLASMNELIKQCKGKYTVTVLWEKWQDLATAQNKIADYFLQNDYDALIFFDDDHWGHDVKMVDALVESGALMATIKTYSRHPPFPCALYNVFVNGEEGYPMSVEKDSGREYVDLTGFPMTILRRELFDKISRPYFRAQNYGDARNWGTDGNFCERLSKLGIRPLGIFDFCLGHRHISPDRIKELRLEHLAKNDEYESYAVGQIVEQAKRERLINQDQPVRVFPAGVS